MKLQVVKIQAQIAQEQFVVIMKSELEELTKTITNQKNKIEELERLLCETSHYN